jgi:hypothetical protein
MTARPAGPGQETSFSEPSALGDIIDRFEEAWRRGERPDIDPFLAGDAGARSLLLIELIHIDLEYRLKARDAVRVESYLARYPEVAGNPRRALDLLATEYRQRRRHEPELTIADYQRRFPQWREELSVRLGDDWPTLSPAGYAGTPQARGAAVTQEDSDTQCRPPRTTAENSLPDGTVHSARYTILRPHAKGGLGEVLVAEDTELKRSVALKRIQKRFAGDAGARRRFLNEAEITARLEHPGIVPIYGLVQDEHGQPCYAMRFIEGESLAEAIRRFHGAGSPRFDSLAFRLLLQRFISVCETMAYAHSKQVKVTPNDTDRKAYPRVKFVYLIRTSALYSQPVPLSSLSITKIHYGRKITEAEFRELQKLAGGIREYHNTPSLPQSTIELERVLREVRQRLGQSEFRSGFIAAYKSRCAVSGCDAVEALEAAHIAPYSGTESNQPSNGLLLRADIHTLFDLNVIGIDPTTLTVALGPILKNTSYSDLQGKPLVLPTDPAARPSVKALVERWQEFSTK